MTSLLSLSSAAPAVVLVPDLELLGYMAVAPELEEGGTAAGTLAGLGGTAAGSPVSEGADRVQGGPGGADKHPGAGIPRRCCSWGWRGEGHLSTMGVGQFSPS